MKIQIETIPHEEHRYPTLGDYFPEGGLDKIRVSDMGNEDYAFLVAVHELVEMYLCKKNGIPEESITSFDLAYESSGKEGEPGDEKDAPYYREHQVATIVERLMCEYLDLNWQEYEAFQTDFFNKNTKHA